LHTYASVEDLKQYLASDSWGTATGADATLLALLEGASRRVDGWTMRSRFGSGFGPRIGTNRYDGGDSPVLLDDDLLGTTSVTVRDGTGGGTVTLTADTDYYLAPYSGPPYTELVFTGLGEGMRSGLRVLSVAGTFGYSAETEAAGTVALTSGSATTATVTGATIYAGQTLLVGSEHVYVTASTGGTALTVLRGQNGTTAAAGTAAASVYLYPREVVTATLQIAARRHRSAQSGLTGDFGGGNLPQVGNRDNETSILRGTVGHLKRWFAA
jgi:hypothetical protein